MKTEHILIEDHLLMRSAYATPQIHAHTAIHLLVASYGDLHCCIRTQQIEAQALFIASDVPHTTASEDGSLLVFLFDETSQPADAIKDRYLCSQDYALVPPAMAAKLQAICLSCKDDLLRLDHEILEALALHPIAVSKDERITECLAYLKDLPAIPDNLFEELVSMSCLSPSRFSHLFKAQTGLSFSHYLVILKMRKFYEFYQKNPDITACAMQAGFDSPSHFAAVCKRQFGITFSDFIGSTR